MWYRPVHLEQVQSDQKGWLLRAPALHSKDVNSHSRQKAATGSRTASSSSSFFFLFKIYLFIVDSAESSLLCLGFLQLQRAGVSLQLWRAGFSL